MGNPKLVQRPTDHIRRGYDCVFSAGMGGENNSATRLEGYEGLEDHRGRRVCGRDKARHHSYRHPYFDDAFGGIFVDNTHSFQVTDIVVHITGGKEILDNLVFPLSETGFLTCQFRKGNRFGFGGFRNRYHNPVNGDLIVFAVHLLGFFGKSYQVSGFLNGN